MMLSHLVRVVVVQPPSLPLQVNSREDAAAHEERSGNTRALGDANAVKHGGEPESRISQYPKHSSDVVTYQKGPMNPQVDRTKLINTPTLPAS